MQRRLKHDIGAVANQTIISYALADRDVTSRLVDETGAFERWFKCCGS